MIGIVEAPIDEAAVTASVRANEAGAVVTFLGTARSSSCDREVLRLEYEAYTEMAERMMNEIVEELKERFSATGAAFVHRVGRVEIGETIVAIAVSAPHSKEAFDAARHAVTRLKEEVPIWKKEYYTDGEEWIGGEPLPNDIM